MDAERVEGPAPHSHAAWKPDRRFWPFWTWFEVMRWAAQRGGHRG